MATKKTAMKATKTKSPKKGTVGWLIEQLQKFLADMEVLREQLPSRRGRPTRQEAVVRIALTSLQSAYQAVANAEQSVVESDD